MMRTTIDQYYIYIFGVERKDMIAIVYMCFFLLTYVGKVRTYAQSDSKVIDTMQM